MREKIKSFMHGWWGSLAIALVLALILRSSVVCAYEIPTGSMENSLLIGDHLLVNKMAYGAKVPFLGTEVVTWGEPRFGDVVVFDYPKNPSLTFVKRVIGLPGDVIVGKDKQIWRNGELLDEPYIRHIDPMLRSDRDDFGPITVPEGKYFLMGDNRDNSSDSRVWGFVDRSAILGRAFVIYWSWDGLTDIHWDRLGDIIHRI